MTGRERFQTALAHQEGDRIPLHDSPWATTLTRWREDVTRDHWGSFLYVRDLDSETELDGKRR